MESENPNPSFDNGPCRARDPDEEPEILDVFSLIVNKMIGTSIYTSPAVVYRMTGSKSITLALFGVGFIYCLTRLSRLLSSNYHIACTDCPMALPSTSTMLKSFLTTAMSWFM